MASGVEAILWLIINFIPLILLSPHFSRFDHNFQQMKRQISLFAAFSKSKKINSASAEDISANAPTAKDTNGDAIGKLIYLCCF